MLKCCSCEYEDDLVEELEDGNIVYFCPNCGSRYDGFGEALVQEVITEKKEKVEVPKPTINNKVEVPIRRKVYKVISTRDGWFSNEFNTTKIENILNQYAYQGWTVKSCVTAEIPGLFSTTREEIIIILEKDIECNNTNFNDV